MFRSIEIQIDSAGTPRCASACAVSFIMISGPQTNAVVFAGSNRQSGRRVVTTPTSPYQSRPAASTVVWIRISRRVIQSRTSSAKTRSFGVLAP